MPVVQESALGDQAKATDEKLYSEYVQRRALETEIVDARAKIDETGAKFNDDVEQLDKKLDKQVTIVQELKETVDGKITDIHPGLKGLGD